MARVVVEVRRGLGPGEEVRVYPSPERAYESFCSGIPPRLSKEQFIRELASPGSIDISTGCVCEQYFSAEIEE